MTCFGEMEIEVQGSDALGPHSRFSAAVPDNFFYGAYQMINAAQIMTTYSAMTDVPTCLSSTQRHREIDSLQMKRDDRVEDSAKCPRRRVRLLLVARVVGRFVLLV